MPVPRSLTSAGHHDFELEVVAGEWPSDLTGDVRTELERYGVLAQVGTDAVFASVGDAVDAFDSLPAGNGSPTSGDDAS